ncbi:uncharacterized protein LOC143033881 isoform X3 [Oratosquilla oratoria]|uniref:uncharacterized protein LOC143033881 isoform X3 n=1 Tax=Oratosquilla oratoria TaxID=337810 RepID=UPI003F76DD0A
MYSRSNFEERSYSFEERDSPSCGCGLGARPSRREDSFDQSVNLSTYHRRFDQLRELARRQELLAASEPAEVFSPLADLPDVFLHRHRRTELSGDSSCGGAGPRRPHQLHQQQAEGVQRVYFDYVRVPPSHTRRSTTLVHPVTQRSAVQAGAIHSNATQRYEATTATPNQNSTLGHDVRKGSRRKGSGGATGLRSPTVQRCATTRATLQGWLLKQGSDGLHLWRRRWFVLSDYCLFYYKGPEEEKVLGSIVLPSFKIAPVDASDRVYRKHAFKAEHQNMRTYYFAADSKEHMTRWMNALCLASILQKDASPEEGATLTPSASAQPLAASLSPVNPSSGGGGGGGGGNLGRGGGGGGGVRARGRGRGHHRSERPSVSSINSTTPSADESDSGFHGFRPRRYRSPDGRSLDEASDISRSQVDRLDTSCDSWANIGDARQPLYANAPPKPRRLNSSRDQSSSPEASPEREDRTHRLYTDKGGGTPGSDVGRSPSANEGATSQHPTLSSTERRTPDAYGATSTGGPRGDYEDVYGGSNASETSQPSPSRRPDSYASSRSTGTKLSDELQLDAAPPQQDVDSRLVAAVRQQHHTHHGRDSLPSRGSQHHRSSAPPRPHSADFLEYDRKHGGSSDMWSQRRGSGGDLLTSSNLIHNRSKSPGHDLDYWSEENYANKMRQSSFYQSHTHIQSRSRSTPQGYHPQGHHHLPQRVPPAGAAAPDICTSPQGAARRPEDLNVSPWVGPSSGASSSGRAAPPSKGATVAVGRDGSTQPRTPPNYEDTLQRHQQSSPPQHNTLQRHHHPSPPQHGNNTLQRHHPSSSPQTNTTNTLQRLHPSSQHHHGATNTLQRHHQSSIPQHNNSDTSAGFIRSASARLPRQHRQEDAVNTSLPDEGPEGDPKKVQQREESMKRLLEWKQRMLQSPLTRKPSPRPDLNTSTASNTSSSHSTAAGVGASNHLQVGRLDDVTGGDRGTPVSSPLPFGRPYTSQGHHLPPETRGLHQQSGPQIQGHTESFGQNIPSQRPIPQGGPANTKHHGTSPSSSTSAGTGGGAGGDSSGGKRREGRREGSSRSRHMSGGEGRRSASLPRYRTYSSDEEDVQDGRETRKRVRRNSRRSHEGGKRSSRGEGGSHSSSSSGPSRTPVHSEDHASYVDSQGQPVTWQNMTTLPGSESPQSGRRELLSENAAPTSNGCVTPIDQSYDGKNNTNNNECPSSATPEATYINTTIDSRQSYEHQYMNNRATPSICPTTTSVASNSPSVVAPQLTTPGPSSPDYVNINHISRGRRGANSQCVEPVYKAEPEQANGDRYAPENSEPLVGSPQSLVCSPTLYAARDPFYVSDVQLPSKSETRHVDPPAMNGVSQQHDFQAGSRPEANKSFLHSMTRSGDPQALVQRRHPSVDSSAGFSSYDSNAQRADSPASHRSVRGLDDVTSKYSDSGYDTLRAEVSSQKGDRRGEFDVGRLETSSSETTIVRRRGLDLQGRRPETWSPDKFAKPWSSLTEDCREGVDERSVREYSYEYVTPEDRFPSDGALETNAMKQSNPDLPSLESPRMVQETAQAAMQRRLLIERLMTYTDEQPKDDSSFSEIIEKEKPKEDVQMDGTNKISSALQQPLTPTTHVRTAEALVSPLKAEFAVTETTVVTAQEAQVRHLSEYRGREDSNTPTSPLTTHDTSSLYEYQKLRSPQDIMDSRLSRTNIRKFLFDEEPAGLERYSEESKTGTRDSHHFNKPSSISVKDILKSFEGREGESFSKSEDYKGDRKFSGDLEFLPNGNSAQVLYSEEVLKTKDNKLPLTPTSSILAELRRSADEKRGDDDNTREDDGEDVILRNAPPRPPKKPTLGGDMETMSPALMRLSLSDSHHESVQVHDSPRREEPTASSSSASGVKSPVPQSFRDTPSRLVYSNEGDTLIGDLDRPPEEAPPPPIDMVHSPSLNSSLYIEENYLPMSPPRKPLGASHGTLTGSSISIGGVAPASSSSSLSSKHRPTPEPPTNIDMFGKTELEEHTYIEMSGESSASSKASRPAPVAPRLDLSRMIDHGATSLESPRYYEIGDRDDPQHYEYIYRGASHYEAIYMEVPPSEKESTQESVKPEGEKPEIPSKPLDLKVPTKKQTADSSSTSSVVNKQPQSNASSDADDEASKDLDSLEVPRNPRFSLSDTFRPASYYLSGAEPSSDPDAHDSSDSDLVPPPPIPLSPPPMDDLQQPGHRHAHSFDYEGLETPEPPAHLRHALSASRSLRMSQASLRDDLNSSRGEVGVGGGGRDNKKPFESKSESISNASADKLKRRPLFEDTLNKLSEDDSYVLRSEDRYPESAAYPEDYSSGEKNVAREKRKAIPAREEPVLLPGDKHEASARPKTYDLNTSYRSSLDSSFCSGKIENPYVNEGFQHNAGPGRHTMSREYMNIPVTSKGYPAGQQKETNTADPARAISPDPFAETSELPTYQNVPLPRTSAARAVTPTKQPSPQTTTAGQEPLSTPMVDALRGLRSPLISVNMCHQRTSSEVSSRSLTSPTASVGSAAGVGHLHIRGTSNASVGSETSPRSAPYYYSDVLRDNASAAGGPSDSIGGSSVGSGCGSTLSPRPRSYQLNNQRDLDVSSKRQDIGRKVNQIGSSCEGEDQQQQQRRERLVHELQVSMEALQGTKTLASPDARNVYDADTLRKLKRRAHTPDPDLDTRNVFPHGLSDKSLSPGPGSPGGPLQSSGHRRARSLEGLVDDPPQSRGGAWPTSPLLTSPVAKTVNAQPQASPWPMTRSSSDMTSPRGIGARPASVVPMLGAKIDAQRNSLSSLHSYNSCRNPSSPLPSSPLPTSPFPLSPPLSGRGGIEGRDACKREAGEWEDDSEWAEQLRKASLRHTRSLEHLDERPRRPGDGGEVSSPSRLSVHSPGGGSSSSYGGPQQNKPSKTHLDEYRVDYRQGRVASPQSHVSDNYDRLSQHSETLERTRRGQTFLEAYEWDETEEKFRKPTPPVKPAHLLPVGKSGHLSPSSNHDVPPGAPPPTGPRTHPGVSQGPPGNSSNSPAPHPAAVGPPAMRHAGAKTQQPFLGHGLPSSFEMDREQLRQWDMMSSAPRPATAPSSQSRQAPPPPPPPLPIAPTTADGDRGVGVTSGEEGRPQQDPPAKTEEEKEEEKEEPKPSEEPQEPPKKEPEDATQEQIDETKNPVQEESTTTAAAATSATQEQDIKTAESLPWRPGQTTQGPQYSNYQHLPHPHSHNLAHPHSHNVPHPHSHNLYHHYKSDEHLHEYHDYPETNYHNYHNYDQNQPNNYANNVTNHSATYPPDYKAPSQHNTVTTTAANNSTNNTHSNHRLHAPHHHHHHHHHHNLHQPGHHSSHSLADFPNEEEYNTGLYEYNRSYSDYGTYRRGHHSKNHSNIDLHYGSADHQFSDSELTIAKRRVRHTRGRGGEGRPVSVHNPPHHNESHVKSVHQRNHINLQRHIDLQHHNDLQQHHSDLPHHSDLHHHSELQQLSAGDLLGKTHEELVLLLIKLRRQHAALESSRHETRIERDSQARLAHLDVEHRQEHLGRLAAINHRLHDLDKQYEMGKPLINLVDNMVKLGSLYRGGDGRFSHYDQARHPAHQQISGHDTLQFSRRMQERRIVAEDRREYELATPEQTDLEAKVMQLYKLDTMLHEESLTIQKLQRKKEMLENALLTLNTKSQHGANEGPVEVERRTKQRRNLEREISRLRTHLAASARKLEETAAENSRLEHEMMMLRQKIQLTMARNAQRESMHSSLEARQIEAEMLRVQALLEDLQRRRLELSEQVQRLTTSQAGGDLRPSPTGVVGAAPIPTRRRSHSTWLETDLDRMITRDHGLDMPDEPLMTGHVPVYVNTGMYDQEHLSNGYPEGGDHLDYPPPPPPPEQMQLSSHLEGLSGSHNNLSRTSGLSHSHLYSDFKNLGEDSYHHEIALGLDRSANKPDGEEQQETLNHLDINDADDRMKRYYGILPKEKPLEIKTVRIVKRESTERRRDRGSSSSKRVTIGESSLCNLLEDDADSEGATSDVENEPPLPSFASRSVSLPRNYGRGGPSERLSMMSALMRTSAGNAGTMTRPSNLALKHSGWRKKPDNPKDRTLSAHEQLFGFARDHNRLSSKPSPPASPTKSDPPSSPSPIFKSDAAREIIEEMASEAEKHKRSVPKEKRRHHTISSSKPLTLETCSGLEEGARSRDDCDMVRALRPRNHPDVVKSTLSSRDLRINETTIDSVLGAPNKILIPERYMPDEDDEKEISAEEQAQREQKAESIRKMLTETTANPTKPEMTHKEKREREHILALNQILARQVMEKSRIVAAHVQADPSA